MAARKNMSAGRRAGKTTAMNESIAQANANGQTVKVAGPDGVTVHEPGKKPRKEPRAQKGGAQSKPTNPRPVKENGAAARKTASKRPAKGKVAPKADKPPVEPATAPTPEAKHPGGRPTLYKPEYCDKLIAYFRIEVERTEAVVVPDGQGGTKTEMVKVVNTFPTLTRFADQIDVTRQTLHEWATAANSDGSLKHPEFSYAYARARDLQESLLIEGGMSRAYDARFASLASKNLIGWRDQVNQTAEPNTQAAKKEELDAIYERGIAAAEAARQATLSRELAGEVPGQGS